MPIPANSVIDDVKHALSEARQLAAEVNDLKSILLGAEAKPVSAGSKAPEPSYPGSVGELELMRNASAETVVELAEAKVDLQRIRNAFGR